MEGEQIDVDGEGATGGEHGTCPIIIDIPVDSSKFIKHAGLSDFNYEDHKFPIVFWYRRMIELERTMMELRRPRQI